MSVAEQRKIHAASIKAQICEALGWDEMDYCEFQYEQGMDYLNEYLKGDVHVLESSRIFWNWWKNLWTSREEQLLREGLPTVEQITIRRVKYMIAHDGQYLASEKYPGRVVLEESYQRMVNYVIKDATQIPHNAR